MLYNDCVRAQMRDRRVEYSASRSLSASVVTYNVALEPPSAAAAAALVPLLLPGSEGGRPSHPPPAMVVVSLQRICQQVRAPPYHKYR